MIWHLDDMHNNHFVHLHNRKIATIRLALLGDVALPKEHNSSTRR
jgi:hypothetical protein